jgi:hypothetical protein
MFGVPPAVGSSSRVPLAEPLTRNHSPDPFGAGTAGSSAEASGVEYAVLGSV